ncbi:MAG TPA: cytochrome c oxidase subunit II [Verrucomicrobiae bacterium]|nr:cytochrome c oxidase subunit II [Verrucomicrobiae bacterium]
MQSGFPLFPEQASTLAARVDAVYLYLVGMSSVFIILIFTLIIYFTIRYRRRSDSELPPAAIPTVRLEIAWTVIPLILAMISFAWGASVYMAIFQPPEDALEIRAVGRQWMWKFQHPDGSREINELHVPVGQPVKIILASEDVIHSFYVPAFRVKMDVVPGRYTWAWFEATREGEFHLFCAEYCGTQHSGMIGRVYAMKPIDYQRWLSGQSRGESVALGGERLFRERGCAACHQQESGPLGPALHGLFGRRVKLQSGQTVVADEAYIRESILNPRAKIVADYQPIMPTFQGQLDEETLHQIVVYLKTLGATAEEQTRP